MMLIYYLQFFVVVLCYSLGLYYVIGKYYRAGIFRVALVVPFVSYLLYFPLRLDTKQYAIAFGTVMVFCYLVAIKVIGFGIGSGPLVYKKWTPLQFFVILASLVVPWEFKPEETPGTTPHPFYDPYTRQGYTHSQIIYWCFVRIIILLPGAYIVALYGNYFVGFLQTIVYSIGLMLIGELLLTIACLVCQSILEVPLMLPFARPQFSESFKEFWGKRWDTAVGGLFRSVLFQPTKNYVSENFQSFIELCVKKDRLNNANEQNIEQVSNQQEVSTIKSNGFLWKHNKQVMQQNFDSKIDNNITEKKQQILQQQDFQNVNSNFSQYDGNDYDNYQVQKQQKTKKFTSFSNYLGVGTGIFLAFFASAILHEYVIMQYCGQVTGENGVFFMLQPVLTGVEQYIIMRGYVIKMRWLRNFLVVGLQCILGHYLFFPPFVRCGASERVILELNICLSYVQQLVS